MLNEAPEPALPANVGVMVPERQRSLHALVAQNLADVESLIGRLEGGVGVADSGRALVRELYVQCRRQREVLSAALRLEQCQRCEPTPIDDFRGGHVAGWGGVAYGTNLSGISEDVTGILTHPIATFARIVAEDQSLQADYGPDALSYANAAMETMLSLLSSLDAMRGRGCHR